MKRAERSLETILERDRRPSAAVSAASANRPSGTSEAIGVSVPAGGENDGQLQTVRNRKRQACSEWMSELQEVIVGCVRSGYPTDAYTWDAGCT